MPRSNAETCRAAYEAFLGGEIEKAFQDFDENIVWRNGSDLLPAGGCYYGKAEVMNNWLAEFAANWVDFWMDLDEFLEVGDRVFVLGTTRATFGGQEVKSPICHIWTYRDGLAVETCFFTFEAISYKAMLAARAAPA
jgi:ketosteroid isomerase-like protein